MIATNGKKSPANIAGRWARASLNAYPAVIPLVTFESEAAYIGRLSLNPFTASEMICAAACDGRTPYDQIIESHPESQEMGDLFDYLVWWDQPLNDGPPSVEETWLVISPHPDDVELSMGGLLLNRSGQVVFKHAICFSRLIRTRFQDEFPTVWEASAIRKDEAFLAAQMTGMTNTFLDLPEASLRMMNDPLNQCALDEYELRSLLKVALYDLIEQVKPNCIVAPAAIGNHPDHRMVFDVILDMVAENKFPNSKVHFYEDTPYCASHLAVDDFVARFENSYFKPIPWIEDISAVLPGKLMLSEVYRSQFSRSIHGVIEGISARNANLAVHNRKSDNGPVAAERFWTIADKSFMHTVTI